ncbi:MAG: M43 family zinc metalloprotease [Flavobacteriales bacterium]
MRITLASLSALALLFSTALTAHAQQFTCGGGNDLERMVSLHHNDPQRLAEIKAAAERSEAFTKEWRGPQLKNASNYVVPVVFHIIHSNGPENISDEQIYDAMRILNEDYSRLNPDRENMRPEFRPIAATIGITFRLAQLDPDGHCTNGVTRTVSALTNDGGQDMKDLIQWPRDRYLNVWVSVSAGGDGTAGYSMYPSNVASSWGAAADGVVLCHNYIGSIGTGSVLRSRALTHEVGHWLNLKHTWGDTNAPGVASNCGMSDDVDDTPPTIGWTTCDLNGATCGSTLDNVENFMEYSYCSKMFTEGQKQRMLAALNSTVAGRSNLWSPANLQLTGTDGTQHLCQARFSMDQRIICAGQAITFKDESYNNVTQRNWKFTGGEPAISTNATPVVTYTRPGTYTVELQAGNGTNTVNTSSTVMVLDTVGRALPFVEGFEGSMQLAGSDWTVVNADNGGTFEVREGTAFSGDRSLRMRNYGTAAGQVDELISSTIDLGSDSAVTLSFRYAFARRNSSNNDMLQVWVSRDCGNIWSVRRQLLAATTLRTVPDQDGAFTPASPDQWKEAVITNIMGGFLVSDFRMKFTFTGGGGNDLWLDDININGLNVGVEELTGTGAPGLQVVPNPVTDEATLVADLKAAGNVAVDVLDPLGRVVAHVADARGAMGVQRWALPVAGLRSGLYLVRLQQGDQVQVVRFTKQ